MKSLIVFEGLDGCGKSTHAHKLHKWLNNNGITSAIIKLPDYSSYTGKVIADFLKGDYGRVEEIDPMFVSLLFAANRFELKSGLEYLLKNHVVVMDRYIYSNLAYQAARLTDQNKQSNFIDWLLEFELETCQLPKPTLVIELEKSSELRDQHLQDRDFVDHYERDSAYLQLVKLVYNKLSEFPFWKRVAVADTEHETHEQIKKLLTSINFNS